MFRTPTFAVALPSGDFFDSGSRVDARPAGGRPVGATAKPATPTERPGWALLGPAGYTGETPRVRPATRPAVSF
jgi:hypothetical protein